MIRIFFYLIMMLLALSCNEVESLDVDGSVSSDLPLKINASTVMVTKGELVYKAEDMGSIGLYCAMTGSEAWSDTTTFSKMENRCFTITSDKEWQIDGDPEPWGYTTLKDKYTFFGYSPHSDDVDEIAANIKDGELVIDYVVSSSSKDQPDLMYAVPRKDIYAQVMGGVSLNFYHALASVSFSLISTTGEKITAITISDVVSEGSLSWDYKNNVPTWSFEQSATSSFSVEVDEEYTPNGETSTLVNTTGGYLMMIPQTLTNGVEVVIEIDGEEERTLMIPAGSVWEAGSNYNYIIRLEDGTLDFVFSSDEVSNCYIINPTPGEATTVQIPIEDRINDFWMNYSGKKVNKIKENSIVDDFTVAMVWEDFDGDLSFCYTVLDDADEKMAVLLTLPADFQEGNFVFAVQEDDGYDEDGNSTGKTTLWSWHLWFTDYNPDAIAEANKNNIEIGVDRAYKCDDYNGAVHRYTDVGKNVTVWSDIYKDKFIMDRNIGERNTYSENYGAGAVYYQFGRKDPFPGNGAWYGGKKTTPSIRSSSYYFYESVEYSVDLLFSSSSSSDNWSIEGVARGAAHIWFDKNLPIENYDEGKSIFDPSPLGWRVPVSDTWSSFDATGSTQDCSDNTKSVGIYNYYGCINSEENGDLLQADEVGYVWSANPLDSETGICLFHSASSVTSPYNLIMTYGLPVRAIQE